MQENTKADAPGLQAACATATEHAELLDAVLRARHNLSTQEWIAKETLRRFRARVERAEADARAAGLTIPEGT
jgi:hypothetical protein